MTKLFLMIALNMGWGLQTPDLAETGHTDLDSASQMMVEEMEAHDPFDAQREMRGIMVYGIENLSGTDVQIGPLLAGIKAALSENGRLFREEFRDYFEQEFGVQAIDRIPRPEMRQYAQSMGAGYLLSGVLSPVEAGSKRFDPKNPMVRLTLRLEDVVSGKTVWTGNWELSLDIQDQEYGLISYVNQSPSDRL